MKDVPIAGQLKPAPSAREQKALAEAKQRHAERQPPFRLGFSVQTDEDRKVTTVKVGPEHADEAGWSARLLEAFGTASDSFVSSQISALSGLLRDDNKQIDEAAVESVVAVLDGARPENEIEAMLVIQMATTHALALKLMKRLSSVTTIEQNDSASVTLTRLQRTFVAQVETLASLRRGGKQKVTVEHIHVHPGGQAIVGNVTTGRPGGAVRK